MTSEITKYFDDNTPIRIHVDEKGEPWFYATDVCTVLGLSNTTTAISALDDDEKTTLSSTEGSPVFPKTYNIVNEPGLYHLIFISRKPVAKAFRRWVRHDLLPTYRKTRQHLPDASTDFLLRAAPLLIGTEAVAHFFEIRGNQAKLAANRAVAQTYGVDCMALIGVTGLISEDKDRLLTATEMGHRSNLTSREVNTTLEAMNYQMSSRDHNDRLVWSLTDLGRAHGELMDTGKVHNSGVPVTQIKWRERVVKHICDFLEEVPAIETVEDLVNGSN